MAKALRCRACEARDATAAADRENGREAGMTSSPSGLMYVVQDVWPSHNGTSK